MGVVNDALNACNVPPQDASPGLIDPFHNRHTNLGIEWLINGEHLVRGFATNVHKA